MSNASDLYIDKDLIYHSTFRTLYELPDSWGSEIGGGPLGADARAKNRHNPRSKARLYQRIRVESYILARRAAYEQMLHGKAAHFTDIQGVRFQIAHAKLAKVTITQTFRLPANRLPEMRDHMRKSLPQDWQPSPEQIASYCRLHFTDYVYQLNQFHGEVRAGFAFLALRDQADALVTKLLANTI
jgi:hypothetical protein